MKKINWKKLVSDILIVIAVLLGGKNFVDNQSQPPLPMMATEEVKKANRGKVPYMIRVVYSKKEAGLPGEDLVSSHYKVYTQDEPDSLYVHDYLKHDDFYHDNAYKIKHFTVRNWYIFDQFE